MNLLVKTSKLLAGTVVVPSSKSHSVRALLVAALAPGSSELTNVLDADDTIAARAVCEMLGAKMSIKIPTNDSGGCNILVESIGTPLIPIGSNFFTNNSGITTRFILPILGLRKNFNEPILLDCGEQMRARPILPLLTALNNLGMTITQNQDGQTYPLRVSGKLSGGKVSIDGTTSQFLSALLLALPLAERDSVITVDKLNERPYVQITAHWLTEQNIQYTWVQKNDQDIISIPGGQHYRPFKKSIPGDFSSASYLIAAGVLCGSEISLGGLDFADFQGDKQIVEILKNMGADIELENKELIVRGGKQLRGLRIDCNAIPDLVPTIAVVATQATGKTELVNVPQARLKETDRLHSMTEGLRAMGAQIEELTDGLVIYKSDLQGNDVRGFDDHRTVMALSLAGLMANGETKIDTAESINKTFPGYVALMQRLGANFILS